MELLVIGIKIFIFISTLNVWLFRFKKKTPYRGSSSNSMREEFAAYGLSESIMYLVGGLKIASALGLILSIWFSWITPYAAGLMAVLMLGAIFMHLKINDPLKKSFPAFLFLVLSLFLIVVHLF
ncbi:DoxX family protein [Croceitalea marina]|uniref:DoxX family protein n=1 Tax=Croceitalea marina TaxID=1775166 RepID=A0ABW5MYG8_9FLAO